MVEYLVLSLLLLGAASLLLAAIGLVRLPDVYCRTSALSKAATLGVGFVLLGAMLHFGSTAVTLRAMAVMIFILISSPVAGQALVRAAYATGVPLWEGTRRDELQQLPDQGEHSLQQSRRRALKSRQAHDVEET